jgi:hypothetical protein
MSETFVLLVYVLVTSVNLHVSSKGVLGRCKIFSRKTTIVPFHNHMLHLVTQKFNMFHIHDFRLLLRNRWELHCSGLLHSRHCSLRNDPEQRSFHVPCLCIKLYYIVNQPSYAIHTSIHSKGCIYTAFNNTNPVVPILTTVWILYAVHHCITTGST